MKKPIKIYGPPGTGKTFRLIRRVNAYVRTGTPYHKIGYFAFTKKAAKEARERIGVDEKQVPYFQTLHAFCFHLLNLNESDIMQPHHYEALGKKLNIRVNFNDKYNEEQTHFLTCNNPYFQMIQRSINKDIPLREEFNLNEHDRKDIDSWDTLKHIHINLQEYKTKMHLLDFNDLVKKVIDSKKFPKLKAIFIDEAQDLSPLQWQLYDKLKENCDDIYLAGDDDQAIFAWAGADVNRFIKEPANERVLRYSRRVSRAVQEQSQIAVSKIAGIRKHKEYLPRAQEGFASHINNLGQIDLTKGKWLILTRTKSNLLDIMKELKSKNIYYQSNKGKSFNVGIYNGAMAYTKWIREGKLEEKEINDVREYIPSGNWNPEKNWYDIFVADQKEILYIRNIISGGEILSENARVWVSTIHAAKGGEEDNVILCLDLGRTIKKSVKKSDEKNDEEHRVWYVGATRARNNLYKLKGKTKKNEYKHFN